MKDKRGSIMIETLASCLILLVLAFACIETTYLITDKIHLQRVAREAAREGAITMSESIGKSKGEEIARLYFKDSNRVHVTVDSHSERDMDYTTAEATYLHKVFGNLLPWKEAELYAQATFGWWSE